MYYVSSHTHVEVWLTLSLWCKYLITIFSKCWKRSYNNRKTDTFVFLPCGKMGISFGCLKLTRIMYNPQEAYAQLSWSMVQVWQTILSYLNINNTYYKINKYYECNFLELYDALKLEKSAISKVQKHIICYFKNGKKSIFTPEKVRKLHFW